MFDPLLTAIRFEAVFTASKIGKTGLAVTVSIYKNGVAVVTGAAATAVAKGIYSYTLAGVNVDEIGSYIAVFETADTSVDSQVAYSYHAVAVNVARDSSGRVLLQPAQPGVTIPTVTNVGTTGALTGYTAPPTAQAIRTEMDANSSKLANLDAPVSSRSTFAGGAVASVTAPVTVGTNNDKTGYSLVSGVIDAIRSGLSTHSPLDVWHVSQNATFIPNTMGAKFKLWLLDLAGRAFLSRDENVLSLEERDQVKAGLSTLTPQDVQPNITVNAPAVTVNPTPVTVNPTPVTVNPTPVTVNPTPVNVAAPIVTVDTAPFEAGLTQVLTAVEERPTLSEMNADLEFPEPDLSGLVVNAEPSDWPAVKAKVFALGAARITIQSPVLEGGEIQLVRGDAYKSLDGRALRFEFNGGLIQAVAPRLATVALQIEGATWTQLGTPTTTETGVTCAFELSAAQTQSLVNGSRKYWVKAVTVSNDPFDLAEGIAQIRKGS